MVEKKSITFADDEPLIDTALPKWEAKAHVFGPAVSQGSLRAVMHKHMKFPVIFDDNSKNLKAWRSKWVSVMRLVKPKRPIEGACAVRVIIYVNRPASQFGTGRNAGVLKRNAPRVPTMGRDIDKVARGLLDAGKIAGWWRDDNRVACLSIRREYTEAPERVVVEAWEM